MIEFSRVLADFHTYQRQYLDYQQQQHTAFARYSQFLTEQESCLAHHDQLHGICLFLELMATLTAPDTTARQAIHQEIASAYQGLSTAAAQREAQRQEVAALSLAMNTTELTVLERALMALQPTSTQSAPAASAINALCLVVQQQKQALQQHISAITTLTAELHQAVALTPAPLSDQERLYLLNFTNIYQAYPHLAMPALASALAMVDDLQQNAFKPATTAFAELTAVYHSMQRLAHPLLPSIVVFFFSLSLPPTPDVFLAQRLPEVAAAFTSITAPQALLTAAAAFERSLAAYAATLQPSAFVQTPSNTRWPMTSFSNSLLPPFAQALTPPLPLHLDLLRITNG